MKIYLYNTLTRKKEKFVPIKKGEAGIYCCGPTVYDYAHIGNLRAYLFEDILRRMFLYNNYKIDHVMNITDVGHLTSDADEGEDKMEKGAKREGKAAWDIAEKYTKAFFHDTNLLNIVRPETTPKATDHIKEMIKWIKKLEEKRFTYKTSDGIYYDTSKYEKYADFAKLNLEGLKKGARIEFSKEKKNPSDFALWKFSPSDKKRDMEWESPWGKGFPGWHIECSVMSIKYLGKQFDIHCGGIDHINVHHTNEIAQTEPVIGKKWVNYWLHNDHLVLKEGKMSKSEGNFTTLQTLIDKGFDPLAFRYLCFGANYRTKIEFSWEGMKKAQQSYDSLRNRVSLAKKENGKENKKLFEKFEKEFHERINDNLDTPQAMAIVWNMIKSDLSGKEKIELVTKFDKILGLDLLEEEELPENALDMIKKREEARKNKNWKTADRIREDLDGMNVFVEDTKEGTIWRIK